MKNKQSQDKLTTVIFIVLYPFFTIREYFNSLFAKELSPKEISLKDKYRDVLLVESNYKTTWEGYRVEDFLFDRCGDLLHDIHSGELSLTESGSSFLREHWGEDKMVDSLIEEGIYSREEARKHLHDFYSWQ